MPKRKTALPEKTAADVHEPKKVYQYSEIPPDSVVQPTDEEMQQCIEGDPVEKRGIKVLN